jgi:hypothetical protein
MMRLSRLILIFAVAFIIAILAPPFLGKPFGPFPLMKTGDVVDIFTPLFMIPLYFLLFRFENTPFTLREALVFMALAGLWAEGQGVHLGANSIGHFLTDAKGSEVETVTHFYDEILGHYLWHLGVIGMSVLLIFRQWRHRLAEQSDLKLEALGGLIYGFTFVLMTIEAGTVPIGLPYAIIISVFGLTTGRKTIRQQPILAFFVIAHVFALILYAIWGIYWRGFPQFSEVGLL